LTQAESQGEAKDDENEEGAQARGRLEHDGKSEFTI
jgi:hypothetical protein